MYSSRIFLAAAVMIGFTCAAVSVQAVTIQNGGNIIFMDEFNNDALAGLPTISGSDVGLGYTQVSSDVANSDVEDDATAAEVGPSPLEPREGNFLNLANDGVESGGLISQFTSQNSGTVSATFHANVVGADNGGSLRMVFTNGLERVSGVHSGYLATGFWLENQAGIELPTGIDSDDVVVTYHDGSLYRVLAAQGGTEADGASIDGEGLWHTVTLTQGTASGSQPQFTLNDILLEPVPLPSTFSSIDGLEFGSNGGLNSQAYVDGGGPFVPIVPGDVNEDGTVDINDFNIILQNYGMTGAIREQGDLVRDGTVNLFDFKDWKSNVPAGLAAGVSIPEPGSLVLFGLGAGAMLIALRRRTC